MFAHVAGDNSIHRFYWAPVNQCDEGRINRSGPSTSTSPKSPELKNTSFWTQHGVGPRYTRKFCWEPTHSIGLPSSSMSPFKKIAIDLGTTLSIANPCLGCRSKHCLDNLVATLLLNFRRRLNITGCGSGTATGQYFDQYFDLMYNTMQAALHDNYFSTQDSLATVFPL